MLSILIVFSARLRNKHNSILPRIIVNMVQCVLQGYIVANTRGMSLERLNWCLSVYF